MRFALSSCAAVSPHSTFCKKRALLLLNSMTGGTLCIMDALQFPDYDKDDVGEIIFSDCARLGFDLGHSTMKNSIGVGGVFVM